MSKLYKKSGVDLKAGYESISEIEKQINRIGSNYLFGKFGGVFDLSNLNYKYPVLVSGCDGVGSKIEIAFKTNIHNTIGIDLVAMCCNDVLAQGAKPLYFLDYIGMHRVEKNLVKEIVSGIVDGCILASCDLIGGETAEMRDLYKSFEYDLAGFVVGCVEKEDLIDNSLVKPGQKIVGIASSGLHSNGYSLVRQVLFKDNSYDLDKVYKPLASKLKTELLKPTKIYVNSVLKVLENISVYGIAHITGGGVFENLPRVLNKDQGAIIYKSKFEILPIFKFIQEIGNISEHEMFNVFNMGIGMMLIVDENCVNETIEILENMGEKAYLIGEVTNTNGVFING